MTAQKIIQDFEEYMTKYGGSYDVWYIGITSDINQRLFVEHQVHENGDVWIYTPADSNEIARSVEKYFVDLGCDGGTGGGDNSSKTVYSYKKNLHTNP